MNTRTVLAYALSCAMLAACNAQTTNNPDAMEGDSSSSASAMMEEGSSSLTFVGGSSLIDHDGGFADFTVEVSDSSDLQNSTVTATIVMDSVYTDSDGLTGHLKREDFFDTATYPTATFTSTEVIVKGDSYDIVGDLTLKGVTKSVILSADLDGNKLTASFMLPRKEFGVGNDSYGDKLLDEEVPVTAVVYLQ